MFAGGTGLAHAQVRTTPVNDTELSKRTKKLGILVASGYRAHVIKRGTLMNIGNKLGRFVAYDDPRVADAIFNAVVAQISQEERYEISRVAIEPEAARAIASKLDDRGINGMSSKAWDKQLAPYYEACHCDALLLVTDGMSENMFSEVSPSFGPSFSSKAAVSNSGDAVKAHVRMGLVFMLGDAEKKEGSRIVTLSDVPDYSEDVKKYWPPADGEIANEHWDRLASFVGAPAARYQQTLFRIGLRPSCALPYFEHDVMAQRRGNEPPETLPGTDPSKCKPTPQ